MSEDIKEFGVKRENEERRDGGCAVVFDPETQKYGVYMNHKISLLGLFGGGFDEGEDEKEGVLRELEEESGLYDFLKVEKIEKVSTHYRNLVKEVNRVAFATCFLVILKSKDRVPTRQESHEDLELVWVEPQEILKHWEERNVTQDYSHWIYLLKKSVNRAIELGYDKKNIKYK